MGPPSPQLHAQHTHFLIVVKATLPLYGACLHNKSPLGAFEGKIHPHPPTSIMGLEPAGPSWGSDLILFRLSFRAPPPASPSSPVGAPDVSTCHQDTCSEKKPEQGGVWWGATGICLFICLLWLSLLVYLRRGLGKKIAGVVAGEYELCLKLISSRAGWTRGFWEFDPGHVEGQRFGASWVPEERWLRGHQV